MEAAGFGGIVGEVMIKNVYGRSNKIIPADRKQSVAVKES
jgi:hypothetical protein